MIELRFADDKTLDEIAARKVAAHLERLDRTRWFLSVEDGEKEVCVWFGGRKAPYYEVRDKDKKVPKKRRRAR